MAALLVHGGGGGTCADLLGLATFLSQRGHAVSLPLLPGFGTTPDELDATPAEAWKRHLMDEYEALRTGDGGTGQRKVVVVGHSMGGLLALWLAAEARPPPAGAFVLSAALRLKGLARLGRFVALFKKYHEIDVERLVDESGGRWVGYSRLPLSVLKKLRQLAKETRGLLPSVTVPLVVAQGSLDEVVPRKVAREILARAGSTDKRLLWFEKSGHPIFFGPEERVLYGEVARFLERVELGLTGAAG
ncbi:MAG: alpha/beta fold hydrolase [Promethearchaeota archaeon]